MSNIPSKEGGLSLAAPNVNTQDLFDNHRQTAATGNTPEDQVRKNMCDIVHDFNSDICWGL